MQIVLAVSWFSRLTGALLLCDPETIEQMLPMVAPVPRSWQEWQQRRAFDEQILPQCWTCMDDTANEEGENDGYAICMGEELMINQLAGGTSSFTVDTTPLSTTSSTSSYRPSTYGEISPKGVRQLFHAMKLTSPNAHDTNSSPSSSTVFVDLGSGTGKVVVQAALEIPHLSQAIGWELAPSRHAAAMRALTRARESILDSHYYLIDTNLLSSSRIQLHQGDLFEAAANDNHLYQATHIWIASLCFSPSMMERLEYMLAESWFGGGTTSDRKKQQVTVQKKSPRPGVTSILVAMRGVTPTISRHLIRNTPSD